MGFDLERRIRTAGGWDDVEALLSALGGTPSDGPDSPVVLPSVNPGPPGQTAIRLRAALLRGDARIAAAFAPGLDFDHRVEVLLGAALRDARAHHAAARLWLALEDHGAGEARWWPLCRLLCEGEADRSLDELAAAYIAEGRVPERWRPDGSPLARDVRDTTTPDVAVAAAYAAGVAGDALLDAFADLPLHAPVAAYYRRGRIHALGPRPLLILAASPEAP